MKVQTNTKGDVYIVELEGDLDVFSCVTLKQEIDRLFNAGAQKMILNMNKVPYIDSRGVGVLIYTNSLFKKAGRKFFLTHVNGSVRRVIELTKLIGYLPIANSDEEAIQKM
ncbi:STAS domain-containing protein [Spirochaeta thermophila]|uniref:Anti-sigma factor antagonist n=2 Tax=Winmispira thermophila TaxID=154 RepID=G0GG53_WINT7|nr:STAS domain-containing protein [Spirochaeta thermophila]ADN03156.1 anti sigma b factor antagonist RsbV [Spirochaeta thermophila DSM 6192]AEJ62529.1 anti-sigma-factor antagonist [Spirochaeta thermophila DSM 6578]